MGSVLGRPSMAGWEAMVHQFRIVVSVSRWSRMSAVSGDREGEESSDHGSWGGDLPERWDMKRAVIAEGEVGSPQRARAWAGVQGREQGE